MKILTFLFALVFSLSTFASLPENDLWKYDRFMKGSTEDQALFNKIIDIAYDVYKVEADARGESLKINKLWSDPTVNANCQRSFGRVTINMYGGLYRRAETSPEGFALVLCHEIAHAYGGAPYIYARSQMSAEGQADYAGSKECLKKVMSKLALVEWKFKPTQFMKDNCTSDVCLRGMTAGQSLGTLLATIKNEVVPDYETPDLSVVTETELSYPSTVQCRLDTYLAGTLDKGRPACWFKN